MTIQIANDVLLWPGHAYMCTVFAIPLALELDFAWPARRILEIYLNIAEWGDDGIFGAEAASDAYFHEPAADLTLAQAALMAAVLPDPHDRSAADPDRRVLIHAHVVETRAAAGETYTACFR